MIDKIQKVDSQKYLLENLLQKVFVEEIFYKELELDINDSYIITIDKYLNKNKCLHTDIEFYEDTAAPKRIKVSINQDSFKRVSDIDTLVLEFFSQYYEKRNKVVSASLEELFLEVKGTILI